MMHHPDFVDNCYKNNDLSLLKKLTLVIPTYNRNFYLSRCLWYHAHFPFGQIIVADSSPEEMKIINRETIKKIRDTYEIDIVYLEYEPETEKYGGDIYRKWGDAVQHISSEYAEICTDKEFLIPTTCCKSIMFLSKNPDYVNAFGWRSDCINYFNKQILKQMFRPQLKDKSSPIDRFEELKMTLGNCENMFQIYRKNDLKIIWNNNDKYKINDLRYGEISVEYQPIFMGKNKFLDCPGRIRDLMQMRENKSETNKQESSTLRYPYLKDYPKKYQSELQRNLVECIYNHLPLNFRNYNLKEILFKELSQLSFTWMGEIPTEEHTWFSKKIKPIWNILPMMLKKITLKYYKKGIYSNSKILNKRDPRVRIIKKIIANKNITIEALN